MQHLNTVWQIASTASALARAKHTYTFPMRVDGTFYLQAESAAVRLVRWTRPQVEITTELMPPFGWRVGNDYDDDGVYFVVRRRAVMGVRAVLDVLVPSSAYLVLKLDDGLITLDHVRGTLEIPPPGEPTPLLAPPSHDENA